MTGSGVQGAGDDGAGRARRGDGGEAAGEAAAGRAGAFPDGFLLRPMTPFDLPTVLELEQQLFPLEAWPLEFYLEELAQAGPAQGVDAHGRPATRDYRVVVRGGSAGGGAGGSSGVAGSDGEIVGYAGLMVAGDLADVQTIGVVHGARGLGLGGAQLQWMIDEAQLRGAEALLLEVRADNPGAQALYVKHGFEHIDTRRGYYPGPVGDDGRARPVDALIMRRPLG